MTRAFGATAEFASSAGAKAAVARLIRAGFHRADIDTWPRGGAYLVHVRSGEDDHADAVRALRGHGQRLSDMARAIAPRDMDRFLPLGLAALAGVVMYGLAKRR